MNEFQELKEKYQKAVKETQKAYDRLMASDSDKNKDDFHSKVKNQARLQIEFEKFGITNPNQI